MNPEDSMKPIEESINKDLTHYSGTNVDKLFAQGVNLSEDMTLHEPTCILCSSSCREEIEQKYIETKNYSQTINLFKEKTGSDINKSIIENHMRFHYDRAIREIQKVEYKDRIKRYSDQNLTTLDRISVSFAILSERLMGINSITPSEDESVAQIEKIKSAETSRLMGQLKDLLKLQASILGEMKNNGEVITIPTDDFISIINEALANAKTEGERDLVKEILNKLDAISQKAQ